jgi:lipopolysaccharide/colanic/teichoic acid biosynthesis glycosyltransferase
VKNRTLLLDIKILCMTVIQVFKQSEVNQEGQATMEKFTGSN